MKIRLLPLLGLLVLSGCDIFSPAFSLFQELLPIAIKYAPYALMFLEAPDEKGPSPQSEQLLADIRSFIQQPEDEKKSFSETLANELKNGKPKIVLAVHLDSWKTAERLQEWATKNGKKFKIRYAIANLDLSDPMAEQKISNILIQQKDMIFLADGQISPLSRGEWIANKEFLAECFRINENTSK